DLDTRVDIYALGIVLYQMLVGRVPFDAQSEYELMRLHAQAPMPFARADRPDIPARLDDVIQKCCAKDRAQRYATPDELLLALDAAIAPQGDTKPGSFVPVDTGARATTGSAAASAMPTGSTAPKPSRAGLWVGLMALSFVGLGAALVLTGVVQVPFLKGP